METVVVLRLLAVYVALLSVNQIVPAAPGSLLTNAYAMAMPLLLAVHYVLKSRPLLVPTFMAIAFGFLLAGLFGAWLVGGIYNFADFAKFVLAPTFAILGYNASAFDKTDVRAVAALRVLGFTLLAIPLALIVLQRWIPPDGTEVAIFANRNNAALYMVVLANVLFLLGARLAVVVVFLAISAVAFSTLGVLVAVVLALLVSLGLRRYFGAYVVAVVFGLLLAFGPFGLPVVERLDTLFSGIAVISQLGLWGDLDRLSYLDLYLLTGSSTDLSFFFRLKHWEELIVAWTSGGWSSILFGLGVGSSVFHTDLGLVPHNDYVRFLVETGPLGLIGFAGLTGYLIHSIGRRAVLMSTAAVAIYFFSENLVDNFSAMTMYYYFAGYWARHAGEDAAVVPDAMPPPSAVDGDSMVNPETIAAVPAHDGR
jgi:hypothetical protein